MTAILLGPLPHLQCRRPHKSPCVPHRFRHPRPPRDLDSPRDLGHDHDPVSAPSSVPGYQGYSGGQNWSYLAPGMR